MKCESCQAVVPSRSAIGNVGANPKEVRVSSAAHRVVPHSKGPGSHFSATNSYTIIDSLVLFYIFNHPNRR